MHDKKGANKGKRGRGFGVSGCQMANTDCPRPALKIQIQIQIHVQIHLKIHVQIQQTKVKGVSGCQMANTDCPRPALDS